MKLDSAKISAYNRAYRSWLKSIPEDVYRHECDICYCLAQVIATNAQKDGFSASKIATTSSKHGDDFSNSVRVHLRNENTQEFEPVVYNYHIATAIEVPIYENSDKTETLVADPIIFGKDLVTLKQWQQALGCQEYDFHQAPLGQPLLYSQSGYNITKGDPKDIDADAKKQIEAAMQRINAKRNKASLGIGTPLKKFAPLSSALIRMAQREVSQSNKPQKNSPSI